MPSPPTEKQTSVPFKNPSGQGNSSVLRTSTPCALHKLSSFCPTSLAPGLDKLVTIDTSLRGFISWILRDSKKVNAVVESVKNQTPSAIHPESLPVPV